jgi:hypothetical protein
MITAFPLKAAAMTAIAPEIDSARSLESSRLSASAKAVSGVTRKRDQLLTSAIPQSAPASALAEGSRRQYSSTKNPLIFDHHMVETNSIAALSTVDDEDPVASPFPT